MRQERHELSLETSLFLGRSPEGGRRTYGFQGSIQAILSQGVTQTVQHMGGKALGASAGPPHGMEVFRKIFQSNPLATAEASLGQVASAVPLADIFSDSTRIHGAWQKCYGAIFMWACEDAFTYRVLPEKDNQDECFSEWRSMPTDPMFDTLNLGDWDAVPVKHER